MDRSDFKSNHEPSIVCLLDSMKYLLSTTESRYFMGANRQNIDLSLISFSRYEQYEIVHNFINEMLFVPLNKGIKNSFRHLCNNHLTIIYTYLAGFPVSELNSSENTHGRSSHVRIMHYEKKGKSNYIFFL